MSDVEDATRAGNAAVGARVEIRSGFPAVDAGLASWLTHAGARRAPDTMAREANVLVVTEYALRGAPLSEVVADAAPAAVILLSLVCSPLQEAVALQAGAAAVLPLSADFGDFFAAITAAAGGQRIAGGAALELLAHTRLRLSERQRQIVACLAAGLSTAQTATALEVTQSTVKTHVRRLIRRGGLRGQHDLVAHAQLLLNLDASLLELGDSSALPVNANGASRR